MKLYHISHGIVIKVDDINEQLKLGYTARYPKWATACKFKAWVITKIKDVILLLEEQVITECCFRTSKVAGSVV